ncbi:MAG TPA: acyl-ACP--UDP-N-acetylglucosamine O-acyltransferase, partial [Fibrobacter sp.]|nr:acyl-ACP--UDP-N-acetylglucosamine O-acyltransferase [Fibrobacter sp.]
PLKWASINLHALRHHPEDFPEARVHLIEQLYRTLYRSTRPVNEVIEELKKSEEPLFSTFFKNGCDNLIRP